MGKPVYFRRPCRWLSSLGSIVNMLGRRLFRLFGQGEAKVHRVSDARLVGTVVEVAPTAEIADDAVIEADVIRIGDGAVIAPGVVIKGYNTRCDVFAIGDQSYLGPGTRVLSRSFRMGDYSKLHSDILASGDGSLTIGHNCWVGQNSILNCTADLHIHDNVRIGTYSHIWTHAASGELFEGCTLFNSRPVSLERNAWLVGSVTITPGVTVAERTIVLPGSVVTRSTQPKHSYSGVPALDVTEKLDFWHPIEREDQISLLLEFINEFEQTHPNYSGKSFIVSSQDLRSHDEPGVLLFLRDYAGKGPSDCAGSVFNLSSKEYVKRSTPIEVDWMKFSVGYRIRFVPVASAKV